MPVNRLLTKLSIPAIIGMVVNSLYNLVDAIFVGQGAGSEALAALAISFPLQMTILSLAIMVGVGAASIISRALGSGHEEKAREAAGTAVLFILFLAVLITVAGLSFLEPILLIFGSSKTVLPFAVDYMSIIFMGSIFYCFTVTLNHFIRAEGNTRFSMVIMFIATGLNILLDPIFIFLLDMGIRGAAIATVISQLCAAIAIVIYYLGGFSLLKIARSHLWIHQALLGEILAIGVSTLTRSLGSSLMAIVLYNSINFYGDDIHLAVVGAANRILIFVYLPLVGLLQGLQPVAGFNYGAKNFDRVKKALSSAIIASTFYSSVIFVGIMFFAGPLMSMFGSEQALEEIGAGVLRTFCYLMPFTGFQIIAASYFQAIGKAGVALLLNSARQLLLLVPAILILPLFMGLPGIWHAVPLADFLAVVITAIWIWIELRDLRQSHADQQSGEELQTPGL